MKASLCNVASSSARVVCPSPVAGESVADMLCEVGIELKRGFEKAATTLDKAISERDLAVGAPTFREKHRLAENAYNEWLKSADAWMRHLGVCDTCPDFE